MNILFLISEVEDIVKTGGLADVGKALPLALAEQGHTVTVFLPYYKSVSRDFTLTEACEAITVQRRGASYTFNVLKMKFHSVDVYFIDYPEYFDHDSLYGLSDNVSNEQKFTFFSYAALLANKQLNLSAQALHCNDWHTSMACFFAKQDAQLRDYYADTKSILSIHNAAFQGVCSGFQLPFIDTTQDRVYDDFGYINMLKTGLLHADKICAVSPSYAKEIASSLGSHGIDDIIQMRLQDVVGILNGCDYTQWDPSTDKLITRNYSSTDLSGKKDCKAYLQKQFALPQDDNIPVFGMVCRTTLQKGFGYLLPILSEFLSHKVQLIIVGTGESGITRQLHVISKQHPEKFKFVEEFKPEYAHYVEAGSDFFLMPSQFEPCGLNQMYSLAYGTLPITRDVGGLKDTVVDIKHDAGTGLVFEDPNPESLLNVLRRALLLWHEDPAKMQQTIQNGMQQKFTWQQAAKNYIQLYEL